MMEKDKELKDKNQEVEACEINVDEEIEELKYGIAERVAKAFLRSKITPLLIIAALFIGIVSVIMTPKEEEPQIVVPMVDIFVPYPGAGAKDVEKVVVEPLEKLMWEIPGVEYVYGTAMNDMGMVVVRFKVGENEEESITKLKTKIDYNMDRMPQGVMMPIIKKRSIDDVPQVALTFWSEKYDSYTLRRIAAEVEQRLKEIPDISETSIIGGYKRVVRIEPDITALKSYNLDLFRLYGALNMSNQSLNSGEITANNKTFYIRAGGFFQSVEDVKNLVVGVYNGKPVYLKDVAKVSDAPEIPDNYVLIGFNEKISPNLYNAVTISISKRKGSDSVVVAEHILDKLETLKKTIIPEDVKVTVTRNYGDTAYEKVKTLIEHLLGAILAVIIVMTLTMGWRAGFVVFVALPVTFALTLFVYYMFDYTLNRVTLFALIFVAGLVVDDAIIVVENMERHFKISNKNLLKRAILAVGEVGNPTILATITVIVAIYPMAFVRGLMGPYMKPMPIGASLAMIFSLLVALIVTPWLSYKLLAGHTKVEGDVDEEEYVKQTKLYKIYSHILIPLIDKLSLRLLLTVVMLGLFIGAFMFIPTKLVVMKMLPFDNKNELQVIIDMPEGTPLEETAKVASEIGNYLATVKEVENYQIYAGIAAPYNFNGLVRHYFLRRGNNVADIQVNFVDKTVRQLKSHDLAKLIREPIQEIAKKYNANVKIAEVPPGPPVLSTLVAEVYGPNEKARLEVAKKIKEIFEKTDGVVDVDWYVEDDMKEYVFDVDKEKAALTGISTEMVSKTLYMALKGMKVGIIHTGFDREDVDIILKLPESERNILSAIKNINLISMAGKPVPLSELVHIKEKTKEKAIYHKNLQPVIYVTGDVAGKEESPVYAILKMNKEIKNITYNGEPVKLLWTHQPKTTDHVSVKWDGEWQITYEVFRDLGLAFAAVLVIMYFVLVAWFKSFATPIIMMIPIPLSLLGIIPGHFIFGKFFTATSMIGFIALAGIMVRNAVLLIDFTEAALEKGKDIKEAVVQAGAIRTRPVVLTTVAVITGALFMLPDPIFAGLGVSLITGAVVSTILTLVIIPLSYYFYHRLMVKYFNKQEV
ncbi:acriflavin resistance protein, AcrB/AcrD/AcrF family [Deferribacter desulfuricans SSM1]|uniref:Acriflavin resistance protein, AcrB/AcrD/AcrF family n=1 Tax=Deferribacter desulfuricans (strain DSM 14783 / JCM 11476 / NBRC 101012 / SSM1) TaxID=639282 RepID=D3PAE4_DEFDS|nr:efflux RND transporter permease subunit [Deferribacter desulfuricans]BAI79567.1 acriflavin resistance protein, AcrB/AcrD/AcrF family [Deferribacter desulfuricans SSM1]